MTIDNNSGMTMDTTIDTNSEMTIANNSGMTIDTTIDNNSVMTVHRTIDDNR